MSAETTPETAQPPEQERYCSECNTQVSLDAEACPTCQKTLYAAVRPSWQAGLLAYLWGGLMGGVALVIVKIVESIGGFHNRILEMVVFGIVAVGAWNSKKAQLVGRRDMAVWKPITSTSNLAQKPAPAEKKPAPAARKPAPKKWGLIKTVLIAIFIFICLAGATCILSLLNR